MSLLWCVYGWQVCVHVCGRVTEGKKEYGCIEEKTSILQKRMKGFKKWFKVSPAVFSYFATASASFWPLTANLASTPNREQPLPKSNEQRQKGQLTTRLTLQNFDQSVALWEICGLPPLKNCRRWLWTVINGGGVWGKAEAPRSGRCSWNFRSSKWKGGSWVPCSCSRLSNIRTVCYS